MGRERNARRHVQGARALRQSSSRRCQGGKGAIRRTWSLAASVQTNGPCAVSTSQIEPKLTSRSEERSGQNRVDVPRGAGSMKQLVGIRSWFLLIVIAAPLLIMGCCPAIAQQTPRARADHARAEIAAMNDWTVGIAGGLLEGAPIRLAAEMARVADDGMDLHVLPIVTRGATENVNSLLYLRGIDAAIINSDALEEYKSQMP